MKKAKNSLFEKILNEPKECIYDLEGRIFIDRPVKEFSLILNMLRCDASLILPSDETAKEFLSKEIEFYKLKEYFKSIKPLVSKKFIEDEIKEIEKDEPEELTSKIFGFGWKLYPGSQSIISKDGLTLTQVNLDQFDRSLGDKPMKSPGKYYFEIKLQTSLQGTSETFIGITDNTKNKSSRNNITMQLGGKFRNNCAGNCKVLSQGDSVGVLVDFTMNVVKFFTNGQYNGVSGFVQKNQIYYAICHYKFAGDQFVLSFPPIPLSH